VRYLYEVPGVGTWAYEHPWALEVSGGAGYRSKLGDESSVMPVAWVKSCFLGPGEESDSRCWRFGPWKKLDGGVTR